MDLEYVNGWSLLWDLKILLMTPVRVLRGKGTE
jgi:lipopolysaccharide/colanic/teichoic acid biosynthesis glycosyltransferase